MPPSFWAWVYIGLHGAIAAPLAVGAVRLGIAGRRRAHALWLCCAGFGLPSLAVLIDEAFMFFVRPYPAFPELVPIGLVIEGLRALGLLALPIGMALLPTRR